MKHIRFRHIATSLIMAAFALPSPVTAQTPAPLPPQTDPYFAPRLPKKSDIPPAIDMWIRMDVDQEAPAVPPATNWSRHRYDRQNMLQISGLGDIQLPFDPRPIGAIWPRSKKKPDLITLDLTIARDGKVASCKPGLSTAPSIDPKLCQRLNGKALFRWSSAPPFQGDFAYSQLVFQMKPKFPLQPRLRVAKPGTGLPTNVSIIRTRNDESCLVQILGQYVDTPLDKEICAFALKQAAARGVTMPAAHGETWHGASIEFDLAAKKGYKPGQALPREISWAETPNTTFGQTRYDVPPLADADKMPPLGRLQMPDLGDEAERAYFAKFDKRNFNKGRIWLTRVRVGIKPDGSLASCQPTVSFGSAFADQYLCDAIMRKGRYQFNQAQPIPPGMKPDAVIKYVEQTMRTDGAFVTFDAPRFDDE